MLKKGLGQDKDNYLFIEFEILIAKNGKEIRIDGHKKMFSSLDEMILCYSFIPLDPSVASLGSCCVSPRHKQEEYTDITASKISQMTAEEATKMFMTMKKRDEEKKMMEIMKERLQPENRRTCSIL